MPPKVERNGKAPRARRTRAQIEADLIASGLPVASKPTAAAIKRSRLAANARARSVSVVPSGKSTKTAKDSPTLDRIDYQTIIAYLSKPSIRNALFGAGSNTRVSGLPMSPPTLLNPLAIELNNDYNIRHNTTQMRLNGRVLYLRLKRYKSKYIVAKNFSLRTGSGLSAKNRADGIHTMDALLDSMCPCYKEMDSLFRDKGNVTPFGILDSGIGPFDDFEDDSNDGHPDDSDGNGEVTDGHDHGLDLTKRLASPGLEVNEVDTVTPVLCQGGEKNSATLPKRSVNANNDSSTNSLNDHYRGFINDAFSSPPPTPEDSGNEAPIEAVPVPGHEPTLSPDTNVVYQVPPTSAKIRRSTKSAAAALTAEELALDESDEEAPTETATLRLKTTKRRVSKKAAAASLTAEELALDDSDEDAQTTTATPVTQTVTKRGSGRATLSRRGLDPLPSIDPSHVQSKEHKHALATAIQQSNESRLEMIAKGNEMYQQVETNRIKAELDARASDLSWAKEKYFLERQDQRESESRRLTQEAQKERQGFCERLVREGKSPQEVEAFLALVYPAPAEPSQWV